MGRKVDRNLIIPMNSGQPISRRHALKLAGLGAISVAGAGGLLAACGGDDGGSSTSASPSGSDAPIGEPYKVHFVYVGPPDDNGWTQAHDQARLDAEAALGGSVVTAFTPNIGFDASTTQL